MASLPYVTAPGNVGQALNGIKAAATPQSVSQDFVKTILKIKGGSGNQVTAYLKKIGFAATDGTPTDLYKKFRNSSTENWAALQALKTGYAALYVRNEYMHKLSDDELKGLIVEETGAEQDANVVQLVIRCIKQIKKFVKGDPSLPEEKPEKTLDTPLQITPATPMPPSQLPPQGIGMNLGYTINLNLPATSDPAVFNAIFRALKEHLLKAPNG